MKYKKSLKDELKSRMQPLRSKGFRFSAEKLNRVINRLYLTESDHEELLKAIVDVIKIAELDAFHLGLERGKVSFIKTILKEETNKR